MQSISSQAATYYVATTGSDSNPGTRDRPWRTIAYSVTKMFAGDTTYVRGGDYNEKTILFQRSGTPTAPIKLLNYPQELPRVDFGVDFDSKKIARVEFRSANGGNKAIGWVALEGFELKNGWDGIKFYNLHNAVIRRNIIHHNASQGIKGNGGHHVLIDRNIIHHNGDFARCLANPTSLNCNLRHGLYIDGPHMTISNNLIYGNLSFGITQAGVYPYKPTSHAGPEFATANDWVVVNNTFAYSYWKGAIVVWGSACNNSRYENNIFYENGVARTSADFQGIAMSAGPRGNSIRNNLFYASGSGARGWVSGSAVEGTNFTQSGNIVNTLSPRFVNGGNNALPVSPDFRLMEGSPAINSGLNRYAEGIQSDLAGVSRPQTGAFEMGAYEYGTRGRPRMPGQPTSFKVR